MTEVPDKSNLFQIFYIKSSGLVAIHRLDIEAAIYFLIEPDGFRNEYGKSKRVLGLMRCTCEVGRDGPRYVLERSRQLGDVRQMIERARRLKIVEAIGSVMDEYGNICTEGDSELDMAAVASRKQDDDEVRRLDRLELVRADGSQVLK